MVIPASITDIYTDMRILLGWAWTYLIVAEVVGTMSGITLFINQQARYRNFDNVYAAIGMIGIIGLTTDMFLAWLGTVLFPWKRRTRQAAQTRWSRIGPARLPSFRRATRYRRSRAGARTTRSIEPMSPSELKLPDYREQRPDVAARFKRIRQRPVILRVRDLKKSFGANGSTHVVFDHVSLDIHRREFICVVGPSGCGKSTLARIVAGLDEAQRRRDPARRQAGCRPGPGSRHGVSRLHAVSVADGETATSCSACKCAAKAPSTAESEARQWLDMVGPGQV